MANAGEDTAEKMREAAHESLPVGVVLERREIDNPWQDYEWRAVGVADGIVAETVESDDSFWRMLESGDDWTRFLVQGFRIDLYSGETDGYTVNLAQPAPAVYVVLRPGEEREDHDVEPFAVTVCPYEAMGYAESGDEQVDSVVMPTDVRTWVEAFVERYHIERPFKKRKRDKKTPGGPSNSRPRGRYDV